MRIKISFISFIVIIPAIICDVYQFPCIPVMGFGYISDPMNFAPRLIQSIDFCIENIIIVVPRGSNFSFPIIENMTIYRHPYDLIGVAEGWNIILKSHVFAPWYLICAYDVLFLPGQLQSLSLRFWDKSGLTNSMLPRMVNFAHTRWVNLPGGKGFNLFIISQEVVQNCGYFDENLYPAFWEGNESTSFICSLLLCNHM